MLLFIHLKFCVRRAPRLRTPLRRRKRKRLQNQRELKRLNTHDRYHILRSKKFRFLDGSGQSLPNPGAMNDDEKRCERMF